MGYTCMLQIVENQFHLRFGVSTAQLFHGTSTILLYYWRLHSSVWTVPGKGRKGHRCFLDACSFTEHRNWTNRHKEFLNDTGAKGMLTDWQQRWWAVQEETCGRNVAWKTNLKLCLHKNQKKVFWWLLASRTLFLNQTFPEVNQACYVMFSLKNHILYHFCQGWMQL